MTKDQVGQWKAALDKIPLSDQPAREMSIETMMLRLWFEMATAHPDLSFTLTQDGSGFVARIHRGFRENGNEIANKGSNLRDYAIRSAIASALSYFAKKISEDNLLYETRVFAVVVPRQGDTITNEFFRSVMRYKLMQVCPATAFDQLV